MYSTLGYKLLWVAQPPHSPGAATFWRERLSRQSIASAALQREQLLRSAQVPPTCATMKTADSTHICPFTCILEGDAQETIAEENACRGFYTATRIDPEGEHTRNTVWRLSLYGGDYDRYCHAC